MTPSSIKQLWLVALFFLAALLVSACAANFPLLTPLPSPAATDTPMPTASETSEAAVNGTVASETPVSEPVVLPSATPLLQATPQPEGNGVIPAPAPVGTVVYYESSIEILTYPYEEYTSNEIDTTFNWPYKRFNLEQFELAHPVPVNKTYQLIVLENAYLRVLIAPELGGRILQVFHKPSGSSMFYRNFVVKPTRWGIANQRGWMAVGGLEWNLPVVEHGYDWGATWGILPLQHSENLATVTVFTPSDGRVLNASITISLRAGAAAFEIQPTISNLSEHEVSFDYWHSAALAPGPGNQISGTLRFILPTDQMTIHSTQDPVFPPPGQQVSWPFLPDGREISKLGNWQQFAGMFEYPAAHGPFAAVYDPSVDDGAVRVFPADVARGSKIFSLGWGDALDSANYTDDGSQYVELHGGLAPTFDQHTTLAAGDMISWKETWYPVHGIGGVSTANEIGSLYVERKTDGLFVGFYPTRPFDGAITVSDADHMLVHSSIQSRPDLPYAKTMIPGQLSNAKLTIQIEDLSGTVLLALSN